MQSGYELIPEETHALYYCYSYAVVSEAILHISTLTRAKDAGHGEQEDAMM